MGLRPPQCGGQRVPPDNISALINKIKKHVSSDVQSDCENKTCHEESPKKSSYPYHNDNPETASIWVDTATAALEE